MYTGSILTQRATTLACIAKSLVLLLRSHIPGSLSAVARTVLPEYL